MGYGTWDIGQGTTGNGQRTKENRQGTKGTRDLLYSSKIVEVKNIEWTYLNKITRCYMESILLNDFHHN